VAATGTAGLAAAAVYAGVYAVTYIAGSFAVNALLPPPVPKIAGVNYTEKESPTYSLTSQGNTARVGDAVTISYGRHMLYPDLGAIPYTQYDNTNDDLYLYQLFVVGLGEYDIEKIRIEDTPIENFKCIEYEIIEPNQPITKFNHNVVLAKEVTGQTLKHDEYQGAFTLNKPDSVIDAIEVDLIAPSGMYYNNNTGGLDERSVDILIEARQIDDEGNPIGEFFTVISEKISATQAKQVRRTFKAIVPEGRYEVRAKRLAAESTSPRESTAITWSALKGYLATDVKYKDMTLVAMKMLATDNLSAQTSKKVNFIVTRKLPTWHPQTGWSEPVPTNSIAWALADICRSSYCGNIPDENINLNQLYHLDQEYQLEGDSFNAVFDSRLKLQEMLDRVGKASRTIIYHNLNTIDFVRDSFEDLESMMFTSRNIIKDSLSIKFLLPTSETIDYVEAAYFDERTWTQKTIDVTLPGSKKTKRTQMTMFGITNKEQAIRQAQYFLKTNKYRRKLVTFTTELEGSIPSIGSLIKLSYPMPQWGIDGVILEHFTKVIKVDEETNKTEHFLTLSEIINFEEGKQYFISLRDKYGVAKKSIEVVKSADLIENQVKLLESPNVDIYTGDEMEKTYFIFGEAKETEIYAKVLSIIPKDEYTIQISANIDDSRVYEETPTTECV
ncbi:MAG TPA: phage tail protein, partial [Alphaproteobacteria bacterium]|nr:phage tail protein [Alphaproteobacteria bacterium]